MIDRAAFIRAQTRVGHPPACPEIRLMLADAVTPLWEATETVLEQINLPPPYWAFCWAGGQALTRYVLDHPELVAGRRVLDFAAGCGSVAIAAARAGAHRIEAAEIDPMAAASVTVNATLNDVAVTVIEGDVVGTLGNWDVVLAGDICYERAMADHVWPWLKALAAAGAEVVMADPGRAYLPKAGLLELARFTVETSIDLEDRPSREVAVYRIVG